MKTKTLSLFVLALCSYLPADTYFGPAAPAMEPQTELERLTVIMAKYVSVKQSHVVENSNLKRCSRSEPAIWKELF